MGLNAKQKEIYKVFKEGCLRDHIIKELWLVGGTGSGKTYLPLSVIHRLCQTFSPCRFGVIRKSERVLKRNTIPSYYKMLRNFKSNIKIVDMRARYPNGSSIEFVWSDISKDPDMLNIKGLELTGVLLEEVDQLHKKTYTTIKTRIGRENRGLLSRDTGNKVDLPAFMFATCNPNLSWVKSDIYDLYENNIAPPHIYLNESNPIDNLDNLGQDYLDMLETLPEEEKERYLNGSWTFSEDPNQLVRYEWLRRAIEQNIKIEELKGRIVLSIDPADDGSDMTIFAYMRGNTVFRIEEHPKIDANQAAQLGMERKKEYNLADEDIVVDAVGIGAGTANEFKRQGVSVCKFKGGETPVSKANLLEYKNKRAECGWLLRTSLEEEDLVLPEDTMLQQEILAQRYSLDNDKTIQLMAKKDVKKLLGRSPDRYDAVSMANWLRLNAGLIKKREVRIISM